MARIQAACAAVIAVVMTLGVVAVPSAAQDWNDPRTLDLVAQATARRTRQLADTGLADYTATALGSLTFLAQVGEGFPDPPKVVKADQIALEVYWRAPSYSKQLILGRRDTLLLPTDIQYHRDHLGIVQNNFPNIIRLGEGDEVRDVPHPLSAAGQDVYDYAIRDSLRIGIPGRVIDVYQVQFRPRDDRQAAAVGSVYLAREDAQVVRLAISFTRAALIDRQLDDVAIVLDNALIEERFWLPRRQEIEIRRSGTWLDFPARGIIHGGWDICCYRINQGESRSLFTGPEIQLASPERRAVFEFAGPIDSILPPDLATVTSADVSQVQAQARELVRQRALEPVRTGAVLATSVSDLIRVNRVEGVSLGIGGRRRLADAIDVSARVRYGVSDAAVRWTARLAWEPVFGTTLALRGYRELRDASLVPEASGLRNSIAAQEFGADLTEPFDARGVELRLDHRAPMPGATRFTLAVARERTDSTPVRATSARGAFAPTLAVPRETAWRVDMEIGLPPRPLGTGVVEGQLAARFRRREDGGTVKIPGRISLQATWTKTAGATRFIASTLAGATSSRQPQDQIFAGGPVTAPGYAFHQFAGSSLIAQRVEWQVPLPFPSIPLGRWGRTPAEARLAPFAAIVVVRAAPDAAAISYPSLGAGLLTFFDLLRIDVARGLRDGRWRFGVDLTRDLWRIL